VRAAEVTPLPLAPEVVLGAIDIEGRVLPVFSLRRRFGLTERAIEPSDQFLIARTRQRTVALVIDAAQGLIGHPAADIVDAKHIEGSLEQIQGVIPLEGGMLLIQDLDKLLSPDEERALEKALKQEMPHGR
jgi:purine-binding chemotaxis protein CheW